MPRLNRIGITRGSQYVEATPEEWLAALLLSMPKDQFPIIVQNLYARVKEGGVASLTDHRGRPLVSNGTPKEG